MSSISNSNQNSNQNAIKHFNFSAQQHSNGSTLELADAIHCQVNVQETVDVNTLSNNLQQNLSIQLSNVHSNFPSTITEVHMPRNPGGVETESRKHVCDMIYPCL